MGIKSISKVTFPALLLVLLLLPVSQASAFSLNDISSTASDTVSSAQNAAKASALLTDAHNVYSGFSSMTEKMVDAKVTTMSLITPEKEKGLQSELDGFNAESGFNRIVKLTSFSKLMDSELNNINLKSKLTKVVTDSASREKAVSVLGDLKGAYSSGDSSVSKAKSLYKSINKFTKSPASEGISKLALSKLGEYSKKILPYIIEKGPESLKSISSLIKTYSAVL